jgi:hypothetical protein
LYRRPVDFAGHHEAEAGPRARTGRGDDGKAAIAAAPSFAKHPGEGGSAAQALLGRQALRGCRALPGLLAFRGRGANLRRRAARDPWRGDGR